MNRPSGYTFSAGTFERVLSILLFHHLSTEDKKRTLAEIRRVLKPGGQLHIADWGRPRNLLLRSTFFLVQLLDGFDTTTPTEPGTYVFPCTIPCGDGHDEMKWVLVVEG